MNLRSRIGRCFVGLLLIRKKTVVDPIDHVDWALKIDSLQGLMRGQSVFAADNNLKSEFFWRFSSLELLNAFLWVHFVNREIRPWIFVIRVISAWKRQDCVTEIWHEVSLKIYISIRPYSKTLSNTLLLEKYVSGRAQFEFDFRCWRKTATDGRFSQSWFFSAFGAFITPLCPRAISCQCYRRQGLLVFSIVIYSRVRISHSYVTTTSYYY